VKEGFRVVQGPGNRFDDFFMEPVYLSLKNHLYNYQVRKRAVRERLLRPGEGMTLEVGSGISPIAPATDRTVFTELSFSALRCLKAGHGAGRYVVADATRLPFKKGVFRTAVCSEVLEHIEDDLGAVGQMATVLEDGGRLVVTFPHRRDFFAVDDRFVGHHRRYDLPEMLGILEKSGLRSLSVGKVLGPLEKLTMWATAAFLTTCSFTGRSSPAAGRGFRPPAGLVKAFELINRLYAGLARIDARIAPTRLAMVLLIVAEKPRAPGG
jgi:SAM-dependent methyltransferase